MKKLNIINFLFLTIILMISCEDQLNQAPISQLSDERFWNNNNDANSAVASIFDAMQKHYSSRHFYWGEFRGDSYKASGSGSADNISLINNAIAPSFSGALNWSNMYSGISRANLCIKNIPKIAGYDPQLLGEAHFLRAFFYFDAIRVWGDVPLFTEPVEQLDDNAFKSRESKDKILNEVIIPDMLKAEQLVTLASSQFRISRSTVQNFIGEVYMWLGEWQKAKDAFAKVEGFKLFNLTTTRQAWQDLFLNDFVSGVQIKKMVGPELVFSIRYNQTEDSDRSGIYGLFFAGIPSYYISDSLSAKWLAKFPTDSIGWVARFGNIKPLQVTETGVPFYGDFRYFDSRETNPSVLGARVAKYNKLNYNTQFDDTDIHIFRYATMLYNMAEVEANLGNNAAAIAILNRIRKARLLPDNIKVTDAPNKDVLINLILDEKQFESLGEGDRWWDLVRTKRAIPLLGPFNGLNEQTILWPIFRDHLIVNPKLSQNPGYN